MSWSGSLGELAEGTPKRVEIDGRAVCLVRLGSEVHAVDDRCSHAEASLAEGEVDDGQIECWLHGATFDLRTGEATAPPATEPIAVHTVTVSGDTITVTPQPPSR